MQFDAAQFAEVLAAVWKGEAGYRDNPQALSADDARAIIQIVRIVAAADETADAEEAVMCDAVVAHVAARANIEIPPEADVVDLLDPGDPGAELAGVGAQLRGKPTADLAFALAYLVAISDLALAPEEEELGEELRTALGLTEDRADEVAMLASEIVTPDA